MMLSPLKFLQSLQTQQFLRQVHSYLGRPARSAVRQCQSYASAATVITLHLSSLEEHGCLSDAQLERWRKIKADYRPEVPEMFSESV
jgi:hypothetical protein